MRRLSFFLTVFLLIAFTSCRKPSGKEITVKDGLPIEFVEHKADKKVDVLIGGKPFTSYRWPDNVYKPILYPLISAGGGVITRGFPLEPREGESTDHRHQVGNWLNYGNVNGYDFWGNGHSGERLPKGGEIKNLRVEKLSNGEGEASMTTRASWIDPSGRELLAEKTKYNFFTEGPVRMIDRITTLTATAEPVNFKDTKEGMFGIRVARELELPSEQKSSQSAEKNAINRQSTGNYRSSEGISGEEVWGTRARWMNLYGTINDEKISLVISDHPENLSYPTWWHARGYGLFSANPFGAKDFTAGREELNYSLSQGDSVTFRYRIIIASGKHLTDAEINAYADDFARRY